ncbi:ribosomal RNA small subunit methyltransferase A [bacterium]|nr:ribosomal RNA small subunit methyltransferase A [bacterium]
MGVSFKYRPADGQHFLIDQRYISKILDLAELNYDDEALEIGAGYGALTIPLSRMVSRVVAIEKDKRLAQFLKERFSNVAERISIIDADVMDVDFVKVFEDFSKPPILLGNLPYYLATHLIQRLLHLGNYVNRMIFMVQREVAERMTARPSTKPYGYLSLVVEYFARAECLLDVPPCVFRPKPDVESSVIILEPRRTSPVDVTEAGEKALFRLIKSAFSHRRKTLINALKLDRSLNFADIEGACQLCGFEKNIRAEKLTLDDFSNLSKALFN